ncbi:hypothetical protein [Saccharothrix lopnurensis]|uniref:Uncharacterized protein n=1 Tax=Saccharothrix lopnurensis TaxID=1670621 RepID=A0ABW1PA98_9PSEU
MAAELRDADTRLAALETGHPATDLAAVLSWSCAALPQQQATAFGLLGLVRGPDIDLRAADEPGRHDAVWRIAWALDTFHSDEAPGHAVVPLVTARSCRRPRGSCRPSRRRA